MFVSLLYSIVMVKLTSWIGIFENVKDEDDGNDDDDDGNDDARKKIYVVPSGPS